MRWPLQQRHASLPRPELRLRQVRSYAIFAAAAVPVSLALHFAWEKPWWHLAARSLMRV
jgi:hypothetical protein